MRLRERVGEWWIEVRPGPSWGGEGVLVRAVAGGGVGEGRGRTVGILQAPIFWGVGGWRVHCQT
jgi:hypothetical protein